MTNSHPTITIYTGSWRLIFKQAHTIIAFYPHALIEFQCATHLQDPSELVGDLFGTDPRVWDALCKLNPGLENSIHKYADLFAEKITIHPCEENRDVYLMVICEAGWHRSVAVGEKLSEFFKEKEHPVRITHLGAQK